MAGRLHLLLMAFTFQAEIANTLSVIDKNLEEEGNKPGGSFSHVDREDLKSRLFKKINVLQKLWSYSGNHLNNVT